MDNHRFEGLDVDHVDHEEYDIDPRVPTFLRIREINLETGTNTLKSTYTLRLGPSGQLKHIKNSSYAFLREAVKDDSGSEWILSRYLLDLRDFRRMELGPGHYIDFFGGGHVWNPTARILLDIQNSESADISWSIVLFSPEKGIVAQKDFPPHTGFLQLHLSPDGKKVIYFRYSRSPSLIYAGIPWAEVWNSETDQVIPLQFLGIMQGVQSIFHSLLDFDLYPLVQWMPDSKSVILPWTSISKNDKNSLWGDRKFRV